MPINNPIVNANGMWQIWNLRDIYTGPNGTGQYVPKVNDEVHAISGDYIQRYIVTAVDATSLVPTLRPVREITYERDVAPTDVLFGKTSDTYRVLLDQSVTPHRLCVDARVSMHGSMAQYCKVFLGTNISNTGTVISAWYNAEGVFESENIPMELVASDRYTANVGIKTPKVGWTSAELADGEKVTVVSYSGDGTVIDVCGMFIMNSGFIRSTDAYSKAVVGISLESPFMAAPNSTLINYPVNIPLMAMNLIGVVNYSDGSVTRLAVDGNRFSVEGMDAYAPTLVGQECPITLKYRLQAGEVAYGATNAAQDHFSQNYTIVTSAVDGSYAVQLYCYPVWLDATRGYTLSWFLYDLDRSINYDVTNLVAIDTSIAPFRPVTYGVKQTLNVYVNLKNVNAVYNSFTHVQYVDIVLNNPATNRPASGALSNWQVTQQAGKVPLFGQGVRATFYQSSPSSRKVKVNGDFGNFTTWLNAYYTLSRPLYNPSLETAAPAPTHFNLIAGGVTTTYSINQWNDELILSQTVTNSDTVFIEFFKRTAASDLQLSKIAVPLWQVDSVGNYL